MFNIQTPREFLVKDCERVIIVLRVPVRVELALLNILHNLTSAHAVHADIISSALTGCNTQAASQSEACIQHAERRDKKVRSGTLITAAGRVFISTLFTAQLFSYSLC